MEFIREYACQDGQGVDRVLHSRRITHVEGDRRHFAIVAEGRRSGDRTTVLFTHAEFENLMLEYQQHRPVQFRNGFSIAGPARLVRMLNYFTKRYPHLVVRDDATTGDNQA